MNEQTALAPVAPATETIVYSVTRESIAASAERCSTLTFDTPEHYEEGRVAIGQIRSARTAVEKRRKELKAEHLEKGRRIDAAAAELTDLLEAIEGPLQAKKDAADKAKAEAKRKADEIALLAKEAELKAAREADEARIKAEQEAAAAKLADERAIFEAAQKKADYERGVEDQRRADEQAKLDAQKAEIEAATRKLREEQEAAARAESERAARVKAEEDARVAAAKAEEEAKVAAARAVIEAQEAADRATAKAALLEELRPDIEKVRKWGGEVRLFYIPAPVVESKDANQAIDWARAKIGKVACEVADVLEKFTPRGAK